MKKKKKHAWPTFALTILILVALTAVILYFATSPQLQCNHAFAVSKIISEATEFHPGKQEVVCKKCGETATERINATVDLPQMYLNGETVDRITKTNGEMLEAEYTDRKTHFKALANTRFQGHTALGYDKKNYTVFFYEDEELHKKYKVSLNGWTRTHKYCLKANYIDFSSARNIIGAHVWTNVVSSRKSIDPDLRALEFRGAIDGYPTALFVNDEYKGLYTLNIPKDDDTYQIADEPNEALIMFNEDDSPAAHFKGNLKDSDKDTTFDLEYVFPEKAEWPYERLNDLLTFVLESNDAQFRENIGSYLDTDAAIDYLITAYVLGLTANFSKNMMLITYDGKKWIPNLYDLDTACGLSYDGASFFEPSFSLPQRLSNGTISSGTDSLLWDRLLNTFSSEFVARYRELRSDVLSTQRIQTLFEDYMQAIPAEVFEQDAELYPNRILPTADAQLEQISSFLTQRTELLDNAVHELSL